MSWFGLWVLLALVFMGIGANNEPPQLEPKEFICASLILSGVIVLAIWAIHLWKW